MTDAFRRLLERGRFLTRKTQYVIDGAILLLAFALAYLLRFDFAVPPYHVRAALHQLPLVILAEWIALFGLGVYTFIWKYFGLPETVAFARAVLASSVVLLALRLGLPTALGMLRIPLSVTLVNAVLAFGGLVGVRALRRVAWEAGEKRRRQREGAQSPRPAVLLIGAGAAGVMAVREIRSRGELELDVRGFVDDDPLKRGAVIAGIRVLGAADELPRLVRAHGIDHVIITIAEAPRERIARIVEICESVPVRAQKIPALYDLLQGRVSLSRFRDVRTEDLLQRDAVHLDEADLEAFLDGRSAMVTGAGGSIGSELARQIARFAPRRLLLVERAEFALFEIDRELREAHPELEIVPLVADIGDPSRMRAIFRQFRPELIAHAAAHKHVPLMEDNACEAVGNNVFGTLNLGEVAGEHGAETFVMISTDKAVRPSSIMGASKRVAELVVQDLGRRYETRYVAVRFGNVMGSAGSVIPIFQRQIAKGGPVTVTHPEMQRYFMTIPEAAVLVLQASAMGRGGEIFVLDMGEPVLILDLARRMIQLSGYRPFEDIDIVFTGIRPGEKLFEQLETSDEALLRTPHPKILIGMIAGPSCHQLRPALSHLLALVEAGNPDTLRAFLAELLPEAELAVPPPAAGSAEPRAFVRALTARAGT
jgi:FlaA1/EpsC-like NDP-sugar epimerase